MTVKMVVPMWGALEMRAGLLAVMSMRMALALALALAFRVRNR
jgi:hypothetical protein